MNRPRRILLRIASLLVLLPLLAQAQTFLQPTLVPTGNWPDAIYTADINGDGYPDLIYLDHGATQAFSTAHVLLNDGRAHFTPSATINTNGTTLAVADIDQDGHPDIAWIQCTPNSSVDIISVTVARGNGDGTFQAPVLDASLTLPHTSSNFASLLAGHIAHSTLILDLAFVNLATPQLFLLQSGTALTTGTLTVTPIASAAGPLALADLNADGYQDIVLQRGTYAATSFVSHPVAAPRPYATFIQASTITPGTGLHSLLLQDVNRDGRPDLIAEGVNGRIDVFPGNGDGSFDPSSIGGTGTLDGLTGNGGHLILAADLNHDGLLDALTVTPAGVSALLGKGTAYLGLNGIYNAGPTGQSGHPAYAAADFNHDGVLDLAVDSPEGIAILFGNPDGTFQTSRAFAAGQPALSSATGIFTATAHPALTHALTAPHVDVAVSTAATQAQLLRGQGDGTLIADPTPTTTQTGPPNLWSTILAADLTHDGKLDLLLTADGPAAVLPHDSIGAVLQAGDGTGAFAAPQPLVPAEANRCPTAPGFFYGTSALGENLLSPAIVNRDFSGAHYRFNGVSSFPTGGSNNPEVNRSSTCGPFLHNLAILADFRTPGISDAIVQADGHLYFLPLVSGGVLSNIPLGDLSVDGSLTTPGQRTAPALFPLYGGFVSTANGGLDTTAVLGSLVAADLDRDGHQDLIALYANFAADPKAPTPTTPNYLYIWFGDGTGHFPVTAAHPVNPVRFSPTRNYHQAAIADLNRDGVPDLILTDGYLVSVQLGKGDGTFGPETHYLAGQGINSLSTVDLRGIGQTDLVFANGGAYLANPAANRDLPIANPDVNTGGVTVLLNDAPPITPVLLTLAGSVTASPEPSTFGTSFFTTVLFTPPASSPAPTGTVIISIDGTPIGTATVNYPGYTGVTYPAPNTLAVGSHTITAAYSGDGTYAPATYTGTHVVTATPLNGSISASPEPSTFGSPFTITVNGFDAGTYDFSIDGKPIGSVTTTSGTTASIAGPISTPAGTHTISVVWRRTASALAIAATGTHVVTPLVINGSISATPEPSAPGQIFTLVASGFATGNYTFFIDGANIGTIGVYGGTAGFPGPPNLATGSHTISVTWATNDGSQTGSATGTHVVAPLTRSPTSLALVLCVDDPGSLFPCATPLAATPLKSPVTMYYGQILDGVATESSTLLTGTINFLDGTRVFCTINANLSNGMSTCPPTAGMFHAGNRIVTAAYSGDALNTPSTSNAITVNVFPDLTTGTLTTSGSPSVVGTPVTFTFKVSGNFAIPAGTANFFDGLNPLGSVTLDATGTATLTTSSLAVGTHAIAASFSGTADFNPVSAVIISQVITAPAAAPVITLASSSNPAPVTTPVTFTATFAATLGTGSIDFLDGTTLLSTQTLSSAGIATFTTSTLAVGTHPVTARYNGSTNFLPAASPVLNQVITDAAAPPPAAFTLSVTPNPITVAVGHTSPLLVTVSTTAAFTQPVALTCSGLPTQATCTFVQPLLPAAGGSTTLQLAIAAPHNCGVNNQPYFLGSTRPLFGFSPRAATLTTRAAISFFPASFLLILGLTRTRRRLRSLALTLLIATVCILSLSTLTGCGACTDLGTRPGRYTFTVTATPRQPTGAPAPATQSVNLTINLP